MTFQTSNVGGVADGCLLQVDMNATSAPAKAFAFTFTLLDPAGKPKGAIAFDLSYTTASNFITALDEIYAANP